jgi:hypothetical protein
MTRRARLNNITTLIIPVLVILATAISQIPARAFAVANVDRGGYEMRVWLDTTLSIMSSRVGDRFTATVGDPGPFNLARISGHVKSIAPSELVKGATEMYLSFDRIRLSDGQAYPINAEIIRLYDVPSGQQVGATDMIETRARPRPQTLKRTGIGALAGGIFGVTLRPGGGGAVTRPRLVSAGMIAASGRNELMLDRGVEILLRVYHN